MDENTLQDIYALKQAATTGSAEAMFLYGKAFERGDGVVEDQDEAMKWYEKAALLGETKSMQTLGYIYENDPHKKDIDTSLDWYEKAIAAGIWILVCTWAFSIYKGRSSNRIWKKP